MKKNELGEYIKHLRVNSGYKSQRHFAEVVGISNGTIARIENGTQKPQMDTLVKMAANLVNVNPTELFKKAGYENHNSLENIHLLETFQTLKHTANTEDSRDILKRNEKQQERHWVPQYGPKSLPLVSLSDERPFVVNQNIIGCIAVPNLDNYPDNLFAMKIEENSLTGSRFCYGDILVVKKDDEFETDKTTLIYVSEAGLSLRKVKKAESGEVWLLPINENHDPILYKKRRVRLIGTVVQVIFQP